jgi:hypothetical protein
MRQHDHERGPAAASQRRGDQRARRPPDSAERAGPALGETRKHLGKARMIL